MTKIYETVGAIDRAAAPTALLGEESDAILIDNEGDEYLIAKPRSSEGDDE